MEHVNHITEPIEIKDQDITIESVVKLDDHIIIKAKLDYQTPMLILSEKHD